MVRLGRVVSLARERRWFTEQLVEHAALRVKNAARQREVELPNIPRTLPFALSFFKTTRGVAPRLHAEGRVRHEEFFRLFGEFVAQWKGFRYVALPFGTPFIAPLER